MVAIPWPTSTSPGSVPQEGAGRLINAFAIPRGEQIGAIYHRVPGVTAFGAQSEMASDWTWWSPGVEWFNTAEPAFVPTGSFRGGVQVESTLYGVFGEKVYAVDSSGAYDEIGNLSGSDRVYFARNNASPPEVAVVCAAGPFAIINGAFGAYPDSDVGSPNSVCSHEGFFIFTYGDGTAVSSEINSTNINSLAFVTAETNPDGLTRAWSDKGLLYLAGPVTIEIWGKPIVAAPAFPFTRQNNYNITPGLITPNAVAGFEPEFAQNIYCASDHTVRMLTGYTPTQIAPAELCELIQAAESDELEAMCYVANGNHFWQLSSTDWTWVYNANTQTWHERRSYLSTRSRFVNASVFAFDEWMAGDSGEAGLLVIDPGELTEDGDPLIFEVWSKPVKQFPDRVRVARADFDFVMGMGVATGTDPIQTNPTVLIYYSDDGSYFWKGPYERKLGRQSKTMKRIILPPTGMTGTQGRMWRTVIADPVHIGLMGGDMYAAVAMK